MLVATAEAAPLRSLAGMRLELGEGVVSLVGPNGAGKTNFLEALYFALTGRSFRTGDRRDLIPFGGSFARAEARDPRRGRDRAHAARLGQPRRGPPPPARRQPRRPRDHRPPPSPGRGLLAGSADPGQGPARRAPGPPRRLHRGALAVARRAAPASTAAPSPSATPCSAGSPAGFGARGRARRLGRDPGRRRRCADRGPGGGGRRAGRPLRGRRDGARPRARARRLEYAPRAAPRRRGDPRRPRPSAATPTSSSAAAPGARTSTS